MGFAVRTRTRWLVAVVVAVLAAATAGGCWLDRLFEEPEARRIESLAAELGSLRLLAFFAHPDDEIMAAGALEDAARRGVSVHVVTATRGERGTPDVPVAGPDELARVREAELREHARILGVAEQIVWDFPDGEVERRSGEVTERMAAEIRRIGPDTVLTFHPASGATYHPDHRAVGAAATRAVDRADGDIQLVYLLMPRRVMRRFGGERGRLVADNQPPASLAMPIDPAVKLRGWEIHASQGRYVERSFGVPPRFLYFLFDDEYFLVR